MNSEQREAMHELRLMHRPGTDDLSTAIAWARAAEAEAWQAMLAIARSVVYSETDDLLGVCVFLAAIAGTALRAADAEGVLDAWNAREVRASCEP